MPFKKIVSSNQLVFASKKPVRNTAIFRRSVDGNYIVVIREGGLSNHKRVSKENMVALAKWILEGTE